MRICVPCQYPGGPDAVVSGSFEESELLDYYEIGPDGRFEHIAQMRPCLGGCSDPVESIARRDVKAIIVSGISSGNLMRFSNAGVKVLLANCSVVRALIDAFTTNTLEEIGIKRFSVPGKAC